MLAHSSHSRELRSAFKDLSSQLERIRDSLRLGVAGRGGASVGVGVREGGEERSAAIVANAQCLVEEVWEGVAALMEGVSRRRWAV